MVHTKQHNGEAIHACQEDVATRRFAQNEHARRFRKWQRSQAWIIAAIVIQPIEGIAYFNAARSIGKFVERIVEEWFHQIAQRGLE
jgi:hypothetical protein